MSVQENYIYRFGDFQLEPQERRLLGGGKPIPLTPKVFETLVLLVERAGRVVSKDDLIKALWPRGYVEESTVTNHIWQIRRALGDTARRTRFIVTVSKVGYRFTASVATQAIPTVRTTRRHRNVAILGFNNLSQSAKDAWLEPALTAMLGSELGVVDQVRVLPDELVRQAAQCLRAPLAGGYDAVALARLHSQTGADLVVSGSYWVAAGGEDPELRIDLQLQSAPGGIVIGVVSNLAKLSALSALADQSGASLRVHMARLSGDVTPVTTDVAGRVVNRIFPPDEYGPALSLGSG